MSHVRTQIRNAAAAALSGIGASVHVTRVWPVAETELPAVLVYTNGEAIEQEQFGGLVRRLNLVAEVVVQGADLDDAMDSVLVEVEQALGVGLGALVTDLVPSSVEVSTSTEGSAPIGRLRLAYEATYRTAFADPETNL
jgi:hypothetical protein